MIFENNVYLDPLTGMPNFFKLIESDVENIFGEQGVVIILDIVKFSEINCKYGKELGDICLKVLSGKICSALSIYEKAASFRTHGDEFSLILPNNSIDEGERLADFIRTSFRKSMLENGLSDIDVHIFVKHYSEKITSASQFYKMMVNKSLGEFKSGSRKFSKERLLETVIENFTSRIQETLSLLNYAYNLALTDDVSCLPNQRAAKLCLQALVEKSQATNSEFSILFIDGDNLRRYNRISYAVGNEMIKALSSVISNSLRKNDKVFRWLSGDEFLVILHEVNYENALKLAERIRSEVEVKTKDWQFPITVSIGIASYPTNGYDIEDIINKAEKANSMAKKLGKNMVVKWEEKFLA
jgi:diguanylate cyclase (GGDEF)-like protein